MCGICGVVQLRGEPRLPVGPETLDWMTDVMTHRGPDERGGRLAPGIALGVRRLSIVDVEEGHQPVANEDGRVVAIQNGELYNHLELRRQLGSTHRYRSRCDTEILPHLYERYGERYPEHLRGKFATCVWDETERRAIIARDRLGVKPLYYAERGDLLIFASELKSVLASGLVEPELDYEAIDCYLTFGFLPGPLTPLRQVRKLLPGHRLVVGSGGVRIERYWAYPEPRVGEPRLSEAEYGEQLLDRLEESVRLRLMSDVPLGAMLSGGLDSSLIVALMARNMSEAVKTFSVGFREAGEQNELADARHVADLFGTDHEEVELSLSEQTVDLPELVWHLDEPLADLSALGFLALSELASQHVKVALSGQGADELLGGYPRHRKAGFFSVWQRLPAPLRRTTTAAALHGPASFHRTARILAAGDPAARYTAQQDIAPTLRTSLSRGPLAAVDRNRAAHAALAALDETNGSPLDTTLYLDAKLGLVDDMLHYFDRASMAHSLEVRVPFLDHEVVELCARIPRDLKVHRGTTKYVLKRSARTLLPDRVIDRPKVGFFNTAIAGWFRAQTEGAISEFLLAGKPQYALLLDRRGVERLVRSNDERAQGREHFLVAITMLEVWLSTFLPRAFAPTAREAGRMSVVQPPA